jgi:hypothetical protein
MKKIKKTDFLFIIALLSVFLIHIIYLFIVPFSDDEGFYVTMPFRLLNGDSMIQHDWHLTQFSSLFTYLPVYLWTMIRGSTEYIFIFLRCLYLTIHTTIAVVIYHFFKKYGKWAILASIIFYIQTPHNIFAISYQSVFVGGLLLLSLCLLSIYKKQSIILYVFVGICFGCCCVCNPFFCAVFVLYLLGCALWTQRQSIVNHLVKIKFSKTFNKNGKKLTKRQKKEQNQQITNAFPSMENYTCFFDKKAILWITCGLVIIAVISVIFFFSMGGTVSLIFDNIENLLGTSEYDVTSKSIFAKLIDTFVYFNNANFRLFFILPVLFVAILVDKKRNTNSHRFAYLTVAILWSLLFIAGVSYVREVYVSAVSLPFFMFSLISYLLTEKKNNTLFYSMFVPCLIGAFVQYLAADTHWGAIGMVLAINNITGVFFVMDLWNEIRQQTDNDETHTDKSKTNKHLILIISSFCIQILFYGLFHTYCQPISMDSVRATEGVFAGMYMSESQYEIYNKTIDDLNYIKKISYEKNPVLIASFNNWMYIQVDRPMAIYSTWYRGSFDNNQLRRYYNENPNKVPRYIYIETSDPQNANVDIFNRLFDFTRENLSNGVLLTIEGYKF